jgi:lipid-A-disaccharide synthase
MSTGTSVATQQLGKRKRFYIGILALEPSADILGASLMQAMLATQPDIQFVGVGGPRMAAIGFKSYYSFSALSHMGFVEVIKHLPKLLSARRYLLSQFIQQKVDIFIGIDAPDFNLYLEERLKKKSIKTVHYVSPSVWAWRSGRIHRIKRAVDLLLTLFPFEAQFYKKNAMKVQFVGHPLADEIALDVDMNEARRNLKIDNDAKIIALFPGSRSAEINYMARPFLEAASVCYAQDSALQFIVALPNEEIKQQFLLHCEDLLANFPVMVQVGNSSAVLAAADVVLVKSGTVTLEALLYKKPMVIAYIASPLSVWIARKLIHVKYIGLPNLLTDKSLVPEILQEDVKPAALAEALLAYFKDPQKSRALKEEYQRIHHQLRCNASEMAAKAIFELLAS